MTFTHVRDFIKQVLKNAKSDFLKNSLVVKTERFGREKRKLRKPMQGSLDGLFDWHDSWWWHRSFMRARFFYQIDLQPTDGCLRRNMPTVSQRNTTRHRLSHRGPTPTWPCFVRRMQQQQYRQKHMLWENVRASQNQSPLWLMEKPSSSSSSLVYVTGDRRLHYSVIGAETGDEPSHYGTDQPTGDNCFVPKTRRRWQSLSVSH